MFSKKLFSQACENNKYAIAEVLKSVFTQPGLVLEIGSGSGQHAAHFASELADIQWQPSDTGETLESINAYKEELGLDNFLLPVHLNVLDSPWPISVAGGVFSANTAHIMSWQEVTAMFAGVTELLADGQSFCLYGPFNYSGRFTSDGNRRLDAWARSISPESGVRDIEAIEKLAIEAGMSLYSDHEMPANNRLIHFIKNN